VRRNILTLVVVNSLFGLAFGVYDLAFPLFCDDNGIAKSTIGLILSGAGVVNFLIVVYGGRLSDLVGRKGIYGITFLGLAATNMATPLVPNLAYLAVLKATQQMWVSVRGAIRGTLVYESVPTERFTRVIAQLVGLENSFHAAGYACVATLGLASATMSYRGVFFISGTALALGVVLFLTLFREKPLAIGSARAYLSLRTVFKLDLHAKLYLIIAAGFIFTMGIALSHALWMLYFREKLRGPWAPDLAGFQGWLGAVFPGTAAAAPGGGRGAEFALIGLIAVFHRLLLGIPMLLIAPLLRGRFKWLYVGGLIVEGVMIAAPAFADWLVGSLALVAVVWVAHDIIGASIWYPIQERFIQQFSRPDRRGADVAKANALMALGAIAGQALAGPLMSLEPALPFFVGGAMIALASLILIPL
jgi:MFS family permease